MSKKKPDEAATSKEPGFEESLARLEEIVREMEGGSLSLDDMIRRFEEGQALLDRCSRKLNEVERRIEALVKRGDQYTTEPFEAPDQEQEAEQPPSEDIPF